MSYKGIKKILYATPMDVRLLNSIFDIKKEDTVDGEVIPSISDEKIESHLYDADAFIRSYLSAYYSESAFINQTPYYKGPIRIDTNGSYVTCLGVTLGNDAITEQWTITFTGLSGSDNTFTVTGTFSGSQGTGDTGTDFVSTNGDLSIASAAWKFKDDDDSAKPGDKIIIMSYYTHPLIRTISTYLAASALVDYLYAESEVNQSSWAKTYYKKAIDLLKLLANPDSGVGLEGTAAASVEHEAVGWLIDEFGRDITEYKETTYDELPHGNNSSLNEEW